MTTLYDFLEGKCRQYAIPTENVLGHCETPNGRQQGKRCPSLEMTSIRELITLRLRIRGVGGAR